MNTYHYDQHQKEQRQRCREAREEWEAENESVSRADLEQYFEQHLSEPELWGYAAPEPTKVWDAILQLKAEVKYLDNKLTEFTSKKGKKYEYYE